MYLINQTYANLVPGTIPPAIRLLILSYFVLSPVSAAAVIQSLPADFRRVYTIPHSASKGFHPSHRTNMDVKSFRNINSANLLNTDDSVRSNSNLGLDNIWRKQHYEAVPDHSPVVEMEYGIKEAPVKHDKLEIVEEVDETINKLLEVMGPGLFLIPGTLLMIPIAIPALPLLWIYQYYLGLAAPAGAGTAPAGKEKVEEKTKEKTSS